VDLTENRRRLDEALARYERRLAQSAETKDRIESSSGTATSPRREVTATVGGGGELTELSFPTSAWKRMAPAELCAVIVRTVADARQQAMAAVAEALDPMLPDSMPAARLLAGDLDPAELMRAQLGGRGTDGA